ncbi:MAG: DeoR family transcriptional regulator [Thermoflexales bacterium]|nr:DeoR family transcriptional regulator [Thermoflexales bacterium]
MLTSADFRRLSAAGPGTRIDVLSPGAASAERLARSLVAMANAQGGVVLVPLRSGKARVDADEIRAQAMEALLLAQPRLIVPLPYLIRAGAEAEPDAVAVEVPEGLPNVYNLDGRYLARDGSRNLALNARALRELLLVRGEGSGETTVPTGSSKDDLDWARVETYASGAGMPDASVEELLLRRGCVVRQGRKLRPTVAGLLLFGRQPQRWVRGAEVLAARFSGTQMDDAFTRQTISGTLPDQIRKAEFFVAENTALRSRIKAWQRSDEGAYPAGVLREAVVNAIAHRDYRLTGAQVHVLVFADRVEVKSPGRLPGHVTLKNLIRERYSRNEAIVQVLADMGFIERLGYGIDRMVRAMKERNQAAPTFSEGEATFEVTLFARVPDGAAVAAQAAPQSARIEKLLGFVRKSGRITNREYQELCPDVSAESLRRDFVELVERGVLMRVGDKRGTYYILKQGL